MVTPMQRWENPLTARYFQASVRRNLFGDWEVLRVGGRIGDAGGCERVTLVGSSPAGELALAQIAVRRARRGYLRVHLCGQAPTGEPVNGTTGGAALHAALSDATHAAQSS